MMVNADAKLDAKWIYKTFFDFDELGTNFRSEILSVLPIEQLTALTLDIWCRARGFKWVYILTIWQKTNSDCLTSEA